MMAQIAGGSDSYFPEGFYKPEAKGGKRNAKKKMDAKTGGSL